MDMGVIRSPAMSKIADMMDLAFRSSRFVFSYSLRH
jgi:hypothetical protein